MKIKWTRKLLLGGWIYVRWFCVNDPGQGNSKGWTWLCCFHNSEFSRRIERSRGNLCGLLWFIQLFILRYNGPTHHKESTAQPLRSYCKSSVTHIYRARIGTQTQDEGLFSEPFRDCTIGKAVEIRCMIKHVSDADLDGPADSRLLAREPLALISDVISIVTKAVSGSVWCPLPTGSRKTALFIPVTMGSVNLLDSHLVVSATYHAQKKHMT